MGARFFGKSVKRVEDPAFLTGGGQFVDDIHLSGMLEAAFVRSPFPHARIRSIDTTQARAVPSVHLVLTHHDLPASLRNQTLPLLVPNPHIKQAFLQYALARDEVCFVGEVIVIVVADNRYIAEDAAALVEIDFEPLPSIADCKAAIAPDAPLSHLAAKGNITARFTTATGDIAQAFRGAAHVVSERFFIHRGGPFFMECRGFIAVCDGRDHSLTVHLSGQSAHRIKRVLMDMLELGDHELRVIVPDVGGGFGPKGAAYPEYLAVCAAALALHRPVKWIEDRRENFLATHQERDQYWDVDLALSAEGRILGLRGQVINDGGAYLPWGVIVPWVTATTMPGPYVIPAYSVEIVCAMTNKVSTTPVRGAGRPQAAFVMDRILDCAARQLGVSPAEIRWRNLIQPEQMPYNVGLIFRDGKPVIYDSGDYPACQTQVLDAIDHEGFPARQQAARAEGRYIGLGIGSCVEGTGIGPFEGATLRVSTTGKVFLYTGATPQGQSHKTTLAQIAADQLGVDFSDITVVTGDTGGISLGVGSFSARTAVNAGNAAHQAGVLLRAKIKALVARQMEVSEDDLELVNGKVQVVGVPGMSMSFREIAILATGAPGFAFAEGITPGLEQTSYFTPDRATYANGTHACEVEVDIETGEIRILRYVVSHDCGTVINPMVVTGQIVGGVAHGVGNALLEHMVYDETAQPLSTNFGEYLLPSAPDVPNVEIHHIETPSPLNPLGIKGAGEGGTIPAIGAIVGAIENALAPFGVRIHEAPITPQRIVQLLAEARA